MPTESERALLSAKQRQALRARAHALKPVVWIAQSGLTPGALREVDRALHAHELIKVHAAVDGRTARAALLESICEALDAQPIQVIGKILVAFRARPAESVEPTAGTRRPDAPARARPNAAKRPSGRGGPPRRRSPQR